MTQDLHPGGKNYPNETAVDSNNNQQPLDPPFHFDLEAADVNLPINITGTLLA